MIVRLGYVAMSVNLKNASPSKTMTLKQFKKIPDRKAAIKKLERISRENLENTIRHLKYNRGEGIHLYRFSSRLIPLAGHEIVEGWDYLSPIEKQLFEIGQWVEKTNMRVGFHPDHYTLINSAKEHVFRQSIDIIERHVTLFKLMKISPKHRNVLHVGSNTGGKEKSIGRFIDRFPLVPKELADSLILENDDRTFTAAETLRICKELNIPMVLDLHHDRCNPSQESAVQMWPEILQSWQSSELLPKIHISSPKNQSDIRAHADYIELEDILPFLQKIKSHTPHLDVMIEAKQKDNALFDLMYKMEKVRGVEKIDESTLQLL